MNRNYIIMIALILGVFSSSMCVAAEQNLPAIHMKLKLDNASLREMVKARRVLCTNEKDIFLKAKRSGSSAWPAMEKSVKKKRPNYNVEAKIADEPDWDNVAVDFEDEYFYGEMYASYTEKAKYTMSNDGRCKVIESRSKTAELDDGKYRYFVDMKKGAATKYISEAASRKQTDALLSREVSKNPQTFEALKKAFIDLGGSKIKDTMKDAGSEKIVDNQSCTYKSVVNNSKNKLCYWTVMSHYPTILERPIILKSIVSIGKTTNVKQAVSFNLIKALKRDLFSPPGEFKIEDRTR